ncbi:MAG: GNAT family N-acetyltransferase [Pseudomonadota bacterium]
MSFAFHPLTAARWADVERLFEDTSATRNCWCMWWRIAGNAWRDTTRASRKKAFRKAVTAGPPPGILAYEGGAPVGWVQATPRTVIPRFNAGRTSKPEREADLQATWALSCFYTAKSHRRRGLMTDLARAACAFAAAEGAKVVDAAPIRSKPELQWSDGYVGLVPALERAGFEPVEPRGKVRVFMRWNP